MGQLASLLLSPILTRIYSPDLFGVLGFFAATVMILVVVASLRYDMALPLAKSKEDAANLLGVCVGSLLLTTTILSLFIILLPEDYSNYVFGALKPYIVLLPVGFFCVGAYQIMVSYATWHHSFAIIAKTKIYQGVSSPVSQIALGLMNTGSWGLIAGFIIGNSAGLINMVSRLIIKPHDVIIHIKRESMLALAKRFSKFPLVSSWSALISAVGSNNLLLVAVPIIYSNTVAGFIFLTDRIIGRPLLLISTSILQVYIGEAAKAQSTDPEIMRKRFLQITKNQFFIVSFWLAVINATASYFVPIVFGNEWSDAVIYIHILSIYYLPQMVMTPVAHTLQILEKQGVMAIWEFSRFIVILGGLVISYLQNYDPVQAILIYSISQATMVTILLFTMYRAVQKL